jgi:hypothetical protein
MYQALFSDVDRTSFLYSFAIIDQVAVDSLGLHRDSAPEWSQVARNYSGSLEIYQNTLWRVE